MRTGIFGGTFSPPHLGHVRAAACFQKELGLDELLVIPAFVPPNKADATILPGEHRLAMCRLAFDGIPGCAVSDLELRRGGTSYTVLTLRELERADRELFLLVGTDMFLTLSHWREPGEIFSRATVVAAGRFSDPTLKRETEKTKSALEKEYGARIVLLDNPITEISSTLLRKRIAARADLSEWLPAKVEEYIRKENLYHV